MLFVDVNRDYMTPQELVARLKTVTEREKEVLGEENLCIVKSNHDGKRVRMLTHLDVSAEDAKLVASKIKYMKEESKKK